MVLPQNVTNKTAYLLIAIGKATRSAVAAGIFGEGPGDICCRGDWFPVEVGRVTARDFGIASRMLRCLLESDDNYAFVRDLRWGASWQTIDDGGDNPQRTVDVDGKSEDQR
jgi:hypothetical protein